jgi:uncharacterized protein with ATP-grasp and redox domains
VFETMVKDAQDPLKMAVKMAALGNAVDIMVSDDLSRLQATIGKRWKGRFRKEFSAIEKQLGKTRRLVYFGDNAGEIVLDKLADLHTQGIL